MTFLNVNPMYNALYTNVPYPNYGLNNMYNPINMNMFSLINQAPFEFDRSEEAKPSNQASDNNNINTSTYNTAGSGGKFSYTASSQQIMRNAGKYFHKKGTYTPKRGDVAIWTKKGDAAHGHVGIVTKIEGDTVWITEGNCGNAVRTKKYSLSNLMSNAGSRPFNGFIDAHSWLGSDVALKAAKRAEIEKAKGVVEINKSNDSVDIRRYKRGAKNSHQWCAYFTSYCFTDGQNLNATA